MRIIFACLFLLTASRCIAQDSTTNVYFDFNRYDLTMEARSTLDLFIRDYKSANANAPVTLKGYCDSVGSFSYNDVLSENRVKSVYNYLLENGIDKSSFSFIKGYGKRQPVNKNLTEDERRLNRRVEITWQREDTTPPPVNPVIDTSQLTAKDTLTDFSVSTIDSVKEGQVLRLKNINFYGGRHTFLPQSRPALDELVEVMKNNPTLEIEIQGHICCLLGSGIDGTDFDSGDDQLSVNRARAVYYFLADHGISKRRMTYRGFAALHPLVDPEVTETDRTLNRRVEIKIVKK
jgi:outer membrane protein OmpA-like peptidoglycan-associated protein